MRSVSYEISEHNFEIVKNPEMLPTCMVDQKAGKNLKYPKFEKDVKTLNVIHS